MRVVGGTELHTYRRPHTGGRAGGVLVAEIPIHAAETGIQSDLKAVTSARIAVQGYVVPGDHKSLLPRPIGEKLMLDGRIGNAAGRAGNDVDPIPNHEFAGNGIGTAGESGTGSGDGQGLRRVIPVKTRHIGAKSQYAVGIGPHTGVVDTAKRKSESGREGNVGPIVIPVRIGGTGW